MACWNALFDQARVAFAQQRSAERARALGLSALTCLGRHTLSGLLCTAGQQFRDWSAAYRLFERERLAPQALWRVPLNGVLEILPPASPVVALLDDTLVRKRGHRIAATRIPPRPRVRPVPFLLICSTPLRRANPRAAPMPSSGKAGVRSRRQPPSAAVEPNASLICGRPSMSSQAALLARCSSAPMPPSPTERCCEICLHAPPSSAVFARTLASMRCPLPKRKTTDVAVTAATASFGPLPNNGVAMNPFRGPPCKPLPPETSTTSTSNSSRPCAGSTLAASANSRC